MKKIIILLLLVGGVFYFSGNFKEKKEAIRLEFNEDQIIIHSGKGYFTTRKTGSKISDSYLLVGGSKDFELGVSLPVISMDKVQQLEEEYGNFRKCQSSGALQSKNNVKHFLALGVNSEVQDVVEKIGMLGASYKDVVFEMTYETLKIVPPEDRTAEGVINLSGPFFNFILVDDVRIIEENKEF